MSYTAQDLDVNNQLEMYLARVRLCGASDQWTIGDKGKPWTDYYKQTSALFRKMRESRRERVEGNSE